MLKAIYFSLKEVSLISNKKTHQVKNLPGKGICIVRVVDQPLRKLERRLKAKGVKSSISTMSN